MAIKKSVLVIAICLIATAASVAIAQKGISVVKRVSFSKGRTTSILKGSIKRGVSHDYLLRARNGQGMTVHLASKGSISFSILSPSGQSLSDFSHDWTGTLPESGDYRINVLPPTEDDKSVTYTLEVTIR